MGPKDADGMANSVGPDLGLRCLPRPVCLKIWEPYGKLITMSCLIQWKLRKTSYIRKIAVVILEIEEYG